MLLGASAVAIVGAATIAWRMLPRKKVAKLMYQSVRLKRSRFPGAGTRLHAPACVALKSCGVDAHTDMRDEMTR